MPHRVNRREYRADHIDTDFISADGSHFQIGMRYTNSIPEELALQSIYPCIDRDCSTCGDMTQANRQTRLTANRLSYKISIQ